MYLFLFSICCVLPLGLGDVLNDGNCYFCGPGSFNGGSSVDCVSCPPGLASSYGASVCIPPPITCPDGQYVSNSSSCELCSDADSYCYGGACLDDCGYCPSGTYANDFGAAACTNMNSTVCPAGTGAVVGDALSLYGCFDCSAGSYNDGSSLTCDQCAMGSHSPAGASVCSTGCPAGALLLFVKEHCCLFVTLNKF